ncbi:MAG: hypothetical protein K9H13_09225, partial [Bacteroidales bacterium]|nr:hypothetical protein [Bacteroidales bacterium]
MPLPNFLIVGFPRCGTSFLLKTLPLHSFYAHRVREFKLGHPSGFDPEKYSFSDIVLRDLNINQVNISNYDFMFFIRENVLPLFNRNQIKIIVNEEIHQDTKTVLQGIFKLLQL